MARYKIYDNKSDVITPVGEKLTAEQWLDRYQWGRYTKMICLLYTSPSPRDGLLSRMPSSA